MENFSLSNCNRLNLSNPSNFNIGPENFLQSQASMKLRNLNANKPSVHYFHILVLLGIN